MIKQRVEGKEILKTSMLSDNLEWLEIKTDNEIYDDVGSLKHLKIRSETCPIINCPNLESLEIKTKFINYDNFKNCKALKHLGIHEIFFEDVNEKQPFPLDKYKNLISLKLYNILLPEDFTFKGFNNLKELFLSQLYNACSSNMFVGLDNLSKLTLHYIYIINNIFKDLKQLTELNIYGAKVDRYAVLKLPILKHLELNHINRFNNLIFSDLESLEYLKIEDTEEHKKSRTTWMSGLPEDTFSKLYSLKTLDLSKAYDIIKIDKYENIFNQNLTELKINPIMLEYEEKDNHIFNNLFSLHTLYLNLYDNVYFKISDSNNITKLILHISSKKIIGLDRLFQNLLKLDELEIYGNLLITKEFCKAPIKNLTLHDVVIKDHNVFNHFKTLENVSINPVLVSNEEHSNLDLMIKNTILDNNQNLLSFKYLGKNVTSRKHKYCCK